jgi:hypothetical protein
MERQHRQQRPRFARANSDRPPIDAGLHGSQESDVHCASLCRHYARAVGGSTALYRRGHRRYTGPREADPRIDRQAIGRRQGAEMLWTPSSWCVTGAVSAQFSAGGFDLLSAAIGAAAGTGLLLVLAGFLAMGRLARRRRPRRLRPRSTPAREHNIKEKP